MQFEVDWTRRIDYDLIYRQRLQRTQAMIAEKDLAAIMVIKYENVRYANRI
jgi:hypothetical protein